MKNDASKIFLGILATVFGLMALFFGINYNKMKNLSDDYLVEKTEINEEYDILTAEFDELTAEFETIKAKSVDLDGQLNTKLEELEASKSEISRILRKERLSRSELEKARAMINSLKTEKDELLVTVQTLNQENQTLKYEKQELTSTLAVVNTQRVEVIAQRDSVAQVAETLSVEKDELQAEKEELEPIADYGGVIHVSNMYAEGVKYKNSGKEKTTTNYKQVEKLKVCFNLDANPVAEAGEQEYLVRILSPEGVAVFEEQRGSGTFESPETGEGMKYTTKTYVNYENEPKSVCLYWTQNNPFQKGIYSAEVYHKGYKVGSQQFELKSGL